MSCLYTSQGKSAWVSTRGHEPSAACLERKSRRRKEIYMGAQVSVRKGTKDTHQPCSFPPALGPSLRDPSIVVRVNLSAHAQRAAAGLAS
eukprot:358614-Chlamydomonas_euryale.AAC.7